jgi:hypothetical protein
VFFCFFGPWKETRKPIQIDSKEHHPCKPLPWHGTEGLIIRIWFFPKICVSALLSQSCKGFCRWASLLSQNMNDRQQGGGIPVLSGCLSPPPSPPTNDSLSSLLLFTHLLYWKTIYVICLFVGLAYQAKARVFIVFRLILEL